MSDGTSEPVGSDGLTNSKRHLYLIVMGAFLVLLIIMVATFNYSKQNAEADRKADQLVAIYEQAGLPVPADRDQISRVLGDDAAVVCEPIASGVDLGTLKSRLGVGGEFYFRATGVDAKALFGLTAIVKVYCPDETKDIEDFLDDFDFKDGLLDLGSTN